MDGADCVAAECSRESDVKKFLFQRGFKGGFFQGGALMRECLLEFVFGGVERLARFFAFVFGKIFEGAEHVRELALAAEITNVEFCQSRG